MSLCTIDGIGSSEECDSKGQVRLAPRLQLAACPLCLATCPSRPCIALRAASRLEQGHGCQAGSKKGKCLSIFSSSLRQKGKTPVSMTYSSTPQLQMSLILP